MKLHKLLYCLVDIFKGDALRAGFAACTGDIIVMLDADGSADPKEIPCFVAALIAGRDFAKGSRFIRGGGSRDITFSDGWRVLKTILKECFTEASPQLPQEHMFGYSSP